MGGSSTERLAIHGLWLPTSRITLDRRLRRLPLRVFGQSPGMAVAPGPAQSIATCASEGSGFFGAAFGLRIRNNRNRHGTELSINALKASP